MKHYKTGEPLNILLRDKVILYTWVATFWLILFPMSLHTHHVGALFAGVGVAAILAYFIG